MSLVRTSQTSHLGESRSRRHYSRPNVMNKGLSAATCVSHQRPSFIWISDGLLADTFARFCHQKRHGSNVPGPLEAQRRTSRRKNTSLAYATHSAPSVDPSLVLTRSQNVDWWQAPTACELAKGKSSQRQLGDVKANVNFSNRTCSSPASVAFPK